MVSSCHILFCFYSFFLTFPLFEFGACFARLFCVFFYLCHPLKALNLVKRKEHRECEVAEAKANDSRLGEQVKRTRSPKRKQLRAP